MPPATGSAVSVVPVAASPVEVPVDDPVDALSEPPQAVIPAASAAVRAIAKNFFKVLSS